MGACAGERERQTTATRSSISNNQHVMIDKMTLSDTTSNHSMLLALRCTITSVAHSLARSHQRTRTHNTQDQSSTTHASSCMHTSPACVHTVALPAVNKARLSHQVVIRRTHAVAASLSGTTKNHLRSIRCTQHLSTPTAQNTLISLLPSSQVLW